MAHSHNKSKYGRNRDKCAAYRAAHGGGTKQHNHTVRRGPRPLVIPQLSPTGGSSCKITLVEASWWRAQPRHVKDQLLHNIFHTDHDYAIQGWVVRVGGGQHWPA